MPGIIIKEQEDLSLGQLSVIENVVLVPLFVKEYLKDDFERDVKVKKYTLYTKFKNEMLKGSKDGGSILLMDDVTPEETDSAGITKAPKKYDLRFIVEDEFGKKDYHYYDVDKSYFYITELLGMGLHVVVKFIGPDELAKTEWALDSEGNLPLDEDSESEYTFDEVLDIILSELIRNVPRIGSEEYSEFGIFEEFKDRNLYNLKFITSGAHANLFIEDHRLGASHKILPDCVDKEKSYFEELVGVAAKRGDAVALIEIQNDYDLEQGTFINKAQLIEDFTTNNHKYEFAACFYPWGVYSMGFSGDVLKEMPASFGYLMAFAYSIQINDDWFAASGVARGFIPNLVSLNYQVGDSFMHVLQSDEAKWYDRDDFIEKVTGYSDDEDYLPIRINPIMFKGAYGMRVWGNRTFSFIGDDGIWAATRSNISFREYLNVRMLLCDIKKQIYGAATRVTFEPNDDITWLNFKGLVNNLLDRMQNGRGLEWYHWYKEFADDGHGNRRKATIKATLSIKPIEAVEYFDITVYLTDEDAVVAEPVI